MIIGCREDSAIETRKSRVVAIERGPLTTPFNSERRVPHISDIRATRVDLEAQPLEDVCHRASSQALSRSTPPASSVTRTRVGGHSRVWGEFSVLCPQSDARARGAFPRGNKALTII